jgi:hypothetical protein
VGWTLKPAGKRAYTCQYCGDITEQLSIYSKEADIAYCPNDGTALLIQVVGGENTTKPKLKVMHVAENDAPNLREAKGHVHDKAEGTKTKTKRAQEVTIEAKPDPEVEKAFEILRKLNGKATSPELVKELHFEGETARDKARRLMDKLIDAKRVKRVKSETRKGMYEYHIVNDAPSEPVQPVREVAAV